GVLLYRALAGREPFLDSPSLQVLVQRIAREAPPPPSSLNPTADPALSALALSCMAKDPGARPTAAWVAGALDRFIEGKPPAAREGRARRSPLLVPLASLVAGIGGATLVVLLARGPTNPKPAEPMPPPAPVAVVATAPPPPAPPPKPAEPTFPAPCR